MERRLWGVLGCVGVVVLACMGCGPGGGEKGGGGAVAALHQAPGKVQQSGCTDDLTDIFFISQATLPRPLPLAEGMEPPPLPEEGKVGFVVGDRNTILKTTDGGATWRRVVEPKPEGPRLDSVLFGTPLGGWVVERGVLLHTSDGGESWTAASKLPGMFYYYGPHSVTAAAYFQMQPPTCSATVWKTKDGGKTWTALKATLPRNDYWVVFFLDETLGWVAGRGGAFALTQDGGQTWTKKDVPGGDDIVQIQFVTPQRGWMRAELNHDGGIWATGDGGMTWTRQSAGIGGTTSICDMQFLDEKTGFLLVRVEPKKTRLLRTVDGGARWETLGLHDADLVAISFVDANRGWVVGDKGCIFRYGL